MINAKSGVGSGAGAYIASSASSSSSFQPKINYMGFGGSSEEASIVSSITPADIIQHRREIAAQPRKNSMPLVRTGFFGAAKEINSISATDIVRSFGSKQKPGGMQPTPTASKSTVQDTEMDSGLQLSGVLNVRSGPPVVEGAHEAAVPMGMAYRPLAGTSDIVEQAKNECSEARQLAMK